jgi:hypothetical protein
MAPSRVTTVPLAALVEDWSLYPRHAVDASHVADLARAVAAGDVLPPPVADKASLRIVDGFHRTRAQRRCLGDDGQIDVVLRSYASEADLLEDAVRLNSQHGRRLDRQDQARSALMLRDAGVAGEKIALVLHTTPGRVQQLIARVVIVNHPGAPPETQPSKPVVLRRDDEEHRELTPEQYQVMRSSSGWRTSQTIAQLVRELESGLIRPDDDGLRQKLQRLADVIAKVLV